MTLSRIQLTITLALLALAGTPLRAADLPPIPSAQRLSDLIGQAKAWIYSQEKGDNWEVFPAQKYSGSQTFDGSAWSAPTSLAVYTLLFTGESPQDPRLAAAIKFLKNAHIDGTYAVAIRSLVWEQLAGLRDTHAMLARDAEYLLEAIKVPPQRGAGFYSYIIGEVDKRHAPSERYDRSVSQFAVLGMWGLQEAGYEVPLRYWEAVEDGWIREQEPSGGWDYSYFFPDAPVTVPMTAAGIATLFITQDCLHSNEGLDCAGNVSNAHIDRAMTWIAQHLMDQPNNLYTWFGISRIALASGYKYIGDIDWFRAGCSQVAPPGQGPRWRGGPGDRGELVSTCLALLFLERGRAPVMLNKLQYNLDVHGGDPKEADWNQRPRDAANLVRWAGKTTEQFLNWQIVNLDAPVEELHDAPILYIAGDRRGISLTADQEAKLRTFAEQGGLILGNADCGNAQFAEAFRKLGSRLFPAYEFRTLPRNHLLFHNPIDTQRWKNTLTVDGLSNGSRELMLLFPENDPPRLWQTRAYGGHEPLFDFMINLWTYVNGRHPPRYKGQTWIVTADPHVQPERVLKLARLRYDGNWDPEPGGWRRLAAVMLNNQKIDLALENVTLGEGKLGAWKIAHLTGTTGFAFTPAQQAELKQFIDAGGTLIVDACGGAPDFAAAAQDQLAAVFGPAAGEQLKFPLPPTHPAFACGPVKCDDVDYRAYALKTLGTLHTPRIRAIEIAGRAAVLFSPEDLSTGLVGQSVDGICGYEAQAIPIKDASGNETVGMAAGASDIMSSLLQYADGRRPEAAAPATTAP